MIHIEILTLFEWCKGGKSQPGVDDDSNKNLFDLESAPTVEEGVKVSIEKEPERMEPGNFFLNFTLNLISPEITEEPLMNTSNETSIIDNSENLHKTPDN